MTDGLPTLTIWQPWASLIALGIKTIETRSWAAPEHLIGQRIGIHAAARKSGWLNLDHDPDADMANVLNSHGVTLVTDPDLDYCRPVLPRGALLGTARLDACVPMDDDPDRNDRYLMITRMPELILYEAGWWDIPPDEDAGASTDVTDQLPYGDFAPGRWAWLLEDPQPTTSQCPWCAGRGGTPEEVPIGRGDVFPDPGWVEVCPACDGAGRCDPIPARGRQRVWYWTPDQGGHRWLTTWRVKGDGC